MKQQVFNRLVALGGIGFLGLLGLYGLQPFAPSAPSARAAVDARAVEAPGKPMQVKQGEVLMIQVPASENITNGSVAWLGDRKAPLFLQKDGTWQAWVPVNVDQKPGPYTVTVKNSAGDTIHTAQAQVLEGGYSRQNIQVSKKMGGLQPEPGELAAVQALKDRVTNERYWSLPLVSPTPDCMNSPFGNLRFHNGKFTGDYHKGMDTRSPAGRPIKAVAGGTVVIARQYRLHGGTVGIDHGQGVNSIYIHMSKILVKPGEKVQAGDAIGHVGSTGFATGPHLHWGLYVNGLPVNPLPWMQGVKRC